MDDESNVFNYFNLPQRLLSWWMTQARRPVSDFLAPQTLTQPILPGWAFGNVINVTESNSSSPETEYQILAEESYGRQIGHLMDAVMALINERPKKKPLPKELQAFVEKHDKIEKIKSRADMVRIKRAESELERLREKLPDEYRRIASLLAEKAGKMQRGPKVSPKKKI